MAFRSIESACREEEEKREEGMKVVMMEPVLLLVILEETEDFREGSAGQREREEIEVTLALEAKVFPASSLRFLRRRRRRGRM